MWFKANQGAYDDQWTTKAVPAVNGTNIDTWENQALVPNNDIVTNSSYPANGCVFVDGASATAVNYNAAINLSSCAAGIFTDTTSPNYGNTNDFFGYTNGLAYQGGSHTDFIVGMDSTVTASSEMYYSYGFNNGGVPTIATSTFGRQISNGAIESGQPNNALAAVTTNNVSLSSSGAIQSSVPFSFTGVTTAAAVPVGSADDVIQTVYGFGLQRASGIQDQRINLGPAGRLYELGDYKNIGGNNYNGNLSEVIHYPAPLAGIDRYRVESYLAMKYGLTLQNADINGTESVVEGDYLSSTGAVVWDGNAD